MYNRNKQNIYLQNQVMTATPKKLIILLYDGCIKFMNLAERAILDKKMEDAHINLIKAQNIVMELKGTLNFEDGAAIAEELDTIYGHLNTALIKANIDKDAEQVKKCCSIMQDLRASWVEV